MSEISMSLAHFIGHLAAFPARLDHHTHKGLEHAARVVETEAKHEIGTYQAEASPFVAWAELADATKADRVAKGFSENDPGLRTGAMRDSIGHEIGHNEFVVGSNDDKMVWFELGTSKQPPRSVLGTALVRKEKDVGHILGGSVVSALIGRDVFGGRIPIGGG